MGYAHALTEAYKQRRKEFNRYLRQGKSLSQLERAARRQGKLCDSSVGIRKKKKAFRRWMQLAATQLYWEGLLILRMVD